MRFLFILQRWCNYLKQLHLKRNVRLGHSVSIFAAPQHSSLPHHRKSQAPHYLYLLPIFLHFLYSSVLTVLIHVLLASRQPLVLYSPSQSFGLILCSCKHLQNGFQPCLSQWSAFSVSYSFAPRIVLKHTNIVSKQPFSNLGRSGLPKKLQRHKG